MRVRKLLAVVVVAACGSVPAVPAWAVPPPGRQVTTDFDGDGLADLAVWDPSTGYWRFGSLCEVSPETGCGFSHGHLTGSAEAAFAVPGDYDGDGRSDPAFFDPGRGVWNVVPLAGSVRVIPLGASGDLPVPADYTGDGVVDAAVFRPADGTWRRADGSAVVFGAPGDRPVAGDYDGDGRADLAVFRPDAGMWIVRRSGDGVVTYQPWGAGGDEPVPADYDGDGRADLAVFRPAAAHWGIVRSSDGGTEVVTLGAVGDVPVPADYDGDGSAQAAVYRPPATGFGPEARGTWLILGHQTPVSFGEEYEVPATVRPTG